MSNFVKVFDKQRELWARFWKVEHPLKNPPNLPLNYSQTIWASKIRITLMFFLEEIFESFNEPGKSKKLEELADALHFLAEIGLFIGADPERLDQLSTYGFDHELTYVFLSAGQFAYELKSKPWKKNPAPTDPKLVLENYEELFNDFLKFVHSKYSTDELISAYFAKHLINQERIDANA